MEESNTKSSCGLSDQGTSMDACQNQWTIHVCPSTGGQFQLQLSPKDTIETLNRHVAKKLKLPKERISLLYKERVLKEGTLQENGLGEESKVTLLPNIESGLVSQRPENSIMQALEGLSDTQVQEFLCGKAPLTLAMRLGDHMMFVQLQLSTSAPNSKRGGSAGKSGSSKRFQTHLLPSSSVSSMAAAGGGVSKTLVASSPSTSESSSSSSRAASSISSAAAAAIASSLMSSSQFVPSSSSTISSSSSAAASSSSSSSSAYPSPPTRTVPVVRAPSPTIITPTPTPTNGPKINTSTNTAPVHTTGPSTSSPSSSSQPLCASNEQPTKPVVGTAASTTVSSSPKDIGHAVSSVHTTRAPKPADSSNKPVVNLDSIPVLDGAALAEASRNLHQKLRELSQASAAHIREKVREGGVTRPSRPPCHPAPTPAATAPPREDSVPPTTAGAVRRNAQGAIIESMQHHGQGVYSGTFSGTLNPALQDTDGKPKRSIGTIIHILNDLLGATPQYRAQMHPPKKRAHDGGSSSSDSGAPLPKLKIGSSSLSSSSSNPDAALSQENQVTRVRMERLQQMMEERRQRRKARREARTAPYSAWAAGSKHGQQSSSRNSSVSDDNDPMEVDVEANLSDATTENGGYTQLTQETVVA